MVVEVTRWGDLDLDLNRALASTYGTGGIPVYWIMNIKGRQLEVYAHRAPGGSEGAYPAPTILGETESVELVIEGQVVGTIAVASLLPRVPRGEAT